MLGRMMNLWPCHWSAPELIQSRGQSIQSKLSGVTGGLWEAANGRNYVLPSQVARFIQRLSRDQFRQRRAASHGWDASLRFETHLGNTPGPNFQCQSQHVSAGGI